MATNKTRYTPENTIVHVLDTDKLSKELTESIVKCHPDAMPNWETEKHLALILEPITAIIDYEFVGGDVKDKIQLSVWGNDGHSFECLPRYAFSFTLNELKGYVKETMTLAEFTKDRRGYNSRIDNNEREWVKALNGGDK